MLNNLNSIAPTAIGAGGLTLNQITPDIILGQIQPTDVTNWANVVIVVATVLAQVITLFKKKKSKPVTGEKK